MMDWSFNEHYPSREAMTMDLAAAIKRRKRCPAGGGRKYIQIDEPGHLRPPRGLSLP